MKHNLRKIIVMLLASMILIFGSVCVYANEVSTTALEETTVSENEEEEEEPLSDGKFILTMFLGMLVMASIVVVFSFIGSRKYKISEKQGKRDVF